ncbi:MAG: hypothetical protein WAK17_22650 [Candidatus Nitrosopolaris sp.]
MKTTIIINNGTMDLIKRIGTKGQTYDQIIADLLALKTNNKNRGI